VGCAPKETNDDGAPDRRVEPGEVFLKAEDGRDSDEQGACAREANIDLSGSPPVAREAAGLADDPGKARCASMAQASAALGARRNRVDGGIMKAFHEKSPLGSMDCKVAATQDLRIDWVAD